ncbi:putative cupredoxin-like copper-binding protein [Catenuloplanes nepalensis]|uniref:Cupredoxin-like copper-binding protein n=1 Tax=Catenuloplanes nepalensis TaxID=587533 RepID=A0ABT9MQR9_9ACTN|nr:plastocyanin/azurin family copper-binding protein [Catenuloplanes nepalensis]MDP9793401.1 putative cupredoxin-like copper-binding protein [Catenuloplanes nepalensis]
MSVRKMLRCAGVGLAALLLVLAPMPANAVQAAQTLTWTADGDVTRYKTAPATAAAGETTIVFENSVATGNNVGMPHTLTFDTSTPGYNHDVNLNILANPFDATGGLHTATVTLNPGKYRFFCTIPGHGTMTGELTVTDGPGDPDTTPPTVTGTLSGTQNAAGDYVGSATVTVAAADNQGVATIEYQVDDTSWTPYSAPVAVTALGDHSVQFRATDTSGNVSTTGSVQFTVVAPEPDEDVTPPVATIALAGDRDDAGNYTGPVTATLAATDDDSGVATIEYQLDGGTWTIYTAPVVISAPGMHMLHYRASDNAGNVSAEQMSHFTIVAPEEPDTTPPVVTGTVTGTQNPDGAYVGVATVTVTATDDGGVATVETQLDGGAWTPYTAPLRITAPGLHAVSFRATDTAGNTAPAQSAGFTVVADGTDECPDSDPRDTVVIDGDDTGVPNLDTGDGCTVNDLIAERAGYPTHAAFVRHVEHVTSGLVVAGTLTNRQAGTIVRAAARSAIGS